MVTLSKTDLRTEFAAYRAGLSEADYAIRSRAVVDRMRELPELEAARTVHAYWPLTARREVDIRPLLTELHQRGTRLVLPVVTSFERIPGEVPRLQHRLLDHPDRLRPNRWGIHEPDRGESVPVEEFDVVIVPALGAGRNGHRIGHGFGYYDEFLQHVTASTLCPVYDACLVDFVTPDAHDVSISVIITESQTLRPGPV